MDFIDTLLAISGGVIWIVALIAIIVFVFILVRGKEALALSMKHLLIIYAYVVIFVSLIAFVSSVSKLLAHTFSVVVGPQFTYSLDVRDTEFLDKNKDLIKIPSPARETSFQTDTQVDRKFQEYEQKKDYEYFTIEGKYYEFDRTEATEVLVSSISELFMAFLMFTLHVVLLQRLLKSIDKKDSIYQLIVRIFNFFSLSIFGVWTVVVLPISLYRLINYSFLDWKTVEYYYNDGPGEALAAALVIFLIWIIFLSRTKIIRNSKKK